MALPTRMYWLVKHPPGHAVSITINDIPFYRRWSDCHEAPNGPFNHFLVEGENTVSLTMVEPDPPPIVTFRFAFAVLRHSDDAPLFAIQYPRFLRDLPEGEQRLPANYRTTFRFDEPSPRPCWLDAPKTDFPIEGTPELRAAVTALHDAHRRADADAFFQLCDLKCTELQRYYGPRDDLVPEKAKAIWAPIMAEPWDLDPLDWNEITFERRGGGRTAYVSRKEGKPALFARHKTDPTRTWEANLHLTFLGGQWRVFG